MVAIVNESPSILNKGGDLDERRRAVEASVVGKLLKHILSPEAAVSYEPRHILDGSGGTQISVHHTQILQKYVIHLISLTNNCGT
jgi:hypothetical protein